VDPHGNIGVSSAATCSAVSQPRSARRSRVRSRTRSGKRTCRPCGTARQRMDICKRPSAPMGPARSAWC